METLYFYPTASEYRKLGIDQDADGTWAFEWMGRTERAGFLTEDACRAAALIEGQRLYPGIVPAIGNENAYAAEWSE